MCVDLVAILRNYISTTDERMRNNLTFMCPLQAARLLYVYGFMDYEPI